MSKAIGITDFLSRRFNNYDFDGKWALHLGVPEKNFRMIVFGHPGNGKTEYCLQLVKYLASFTRVYYNSYEQGICKSLQDALVRNNMQEVTGKVIFGNQEPYNEMITRLSGKNSPMVVVLDSRDYMNLTTEQYKKLIRLFPRKAFIVVCWESAGKPKSQYAKDIEYMAEIKVHVRGFKAYPRSRYGGNQTHTIWDRKPQDGEQLNLI